jgi:hypothetical protein
MNLPKRRLQDGREVEPGPIGRVGRRRAMGEQATLKGLFERREQKIRIKKDEL